MEGDILCINQEARDAANGVLKMVFERLYGERDDLLSFASDKIKQEGKTLIIAISGESGAGKSVLSHELAALLRKNGVLAKCLCTDNFYTIPPEDREAWRKEHKDQIGKSEYDWDLINRITDDFRKRKSSTFQVIDLNTQQVEFLTTDFSKVNVIILEGLFAVAAELKDCDFRAFLEAPEERKQAAQGARGKEDPSNPFRQFIMAKEKQDVRNQLLALNTQDFIFINAVNEKLENQLSWQSAKEIFDIIECDAPRLE